ncbi:MAG: TolC family protein [Lentisphaeria bacterium]|nr:TolC family protein [Lentisphaeria bacterium]
MKKTFLYLIAGGSLVACKSKDYEYSQQGNVQAPPTFASISQTAQIKDPLNWLSDFKSKELKQHIDEALEQNLSLQQKAYAVSIAYQNAIISGAPLLPSFDAAAGVSRTRTNPEVNGSPTPSRRTNHSLLLQMSWEVDVWGKLRDQAKAASKNLEFTQEDFAAARLSLAAQVTRAWLDVINNRLQVELALKRVDSLTTTQQIIEKRYRFGQITSLDVRLGRSNVTAAEAEHTRRTELYHQSQRTLETLMGRYPQASVEGQQQLPNLNVTQVPTGIPSELLARRHDIKASMAKLQQAEIESKLEAKSRLPDFTITGNIGFTNDRLDGLIDSDRVIWQIAGQALMPIFEGGAIEARQEAAYALFRQEVYRHAETILTAYKEVENALTQERLLLDREEQIEKSLDEVVEAEKISISQYNKGIIDVTTLLLTQRQVFDTESSFLDIQNERRQNRISLYVALGGGFEDQPFSPENMQ